MCRIRLRRVVPDPVVSSISKSDFLLETTPQASRLRCRLRPSGRSRGTSVADRGYILEKGLIQFEGTMAAIWENEAILSKYLAV